MDLCGHSLRTRKLVPSFRDPDPRLGRKCRKGYRYRWEGDFVILLRADGSVVAYFSEHGATDQEIAREAQKDFQGG